MSLTPQRAAPGGGGGKACPLAMPSMVWLRLNTAATRGHSVRSRPSVKSDRLGVLRKGSLFASRGFLDLEPEQRVRSFAVGTTAVPVVLTSNVQWAFGAVVSGDITWAEEAWVLVCSGQRMFLRCA